MWMQMRKSVITNFPSSPGIPDAHEAFLKNINDIYITHAYHSLSIEHYRVTPQLIAKVSSGAWDANQKEEDRKQRDAMAARGYYQVLQAVKESIEAIKMQERR